MSGIWPSHFSVLMYTELSQETSCPGCRTICSERDMDMCPPKDHNGFGSEHPLGSVRIYGTAVVPPVLHSQH
jgi:hypothetical protein